MIEMSIELTGQGRQGKGERQVPVVNGRYEVLAALGRGATSLVFKVLDLQTSEERALKVLQQTADEDLLRSEFARLSRLKHPNLVQVHDLDRNQQDLSLGPDHLVRPGKLFLVMDLVAGDSPSNWLDSHPEQQRDALLRSVARDLAQALQHLHDHNLVHHDVKPENLLVDHQGRTLLFDLGLATRIQRVIPGRGTLPYLAPEALAGGGDHRVDLYALGATLFQLASGAPPFAGQGARLVHQILESSPRLELDWLTADFRRLVLRLLQKEPLARPPSARWVLAELARLEGDQHTVAQLAARRELLTPAFVGRADPLERLWRYTSEMPSRPTVLLVLGEPGVGKRRLVSEAVRRHRIQAAAGHCGAVEFRQGRLKEVLSGIALPRTSISWFAEGGPPSEGPSLDDLGMDLADALEHQQSDQPLVIHLLDLDHDPVALRWLEILLRDDARRTGSRPLLIVAGVAPRGDAVDLLGHHADTQTIDLDPLSRAETGCLVNSMVGRVPEVAVVERIHCMARGNPALVLELTRQWHAHGDEGLDLDVVQGLDHLVARTRNWLPAQQRQLLDALAAWEDPVSSSVLASILERSEPQVWGDLEQLAANGGLVVLDAGRAHFSTPAHLRAWRRTGQQGAAREVNRRAARLLRQRDGWEADLPRLARCMLAGDLPEALPLALRAGQELASRLSPVGAMELLEQVVARDQGELGREARPVLAQLLIRVGRYDDALDLLDASSTDQALLRAQALLRRGDYLEAEQVLQSVLPQLDDRQARDQALAQLGRLMLRRGRPEQALELVACSVATEQAAYGAEEGEEISSTAAELLEVAGLAHFYLSDLHRAEGFFADGQRRSRRPGKVARFAHLRGMVAFNSGQLLPAEEHYRQALELATSAGDAHGRVSLEVNLGSVLANRGRYGEALSRLSTAIRDLQRLGRTAELASALCNLANLLLLLGDLEHVEPTIGRARRMAENLGNEQIAGFVRMVTADLARRRDRPAEAIRLYREAAGGFQKIGALRELTICRLALAETLAGARSLTEAHQLLQDLPAEEDLAGQVALTLARLALAAAQPALPDETVGELARHCAVLEQQGAARELWRAAAVLGRLLWTTGHPEQARAALGRARETWEEILKHAPEVYGEQMETRDPDARDLASQWATLMEQDARGGNPPPQGIDPPHKPTPDDRIRRLLAINKRLNGEHRLPYLLELILDTAIELSGAERGFLLLVEDDGGLSVKVARNIDQRSLEGEELSLSRSIAERAARSCEPVITVDAAEDGRFSEAVSVSHLRLRSVLAVPLVVKGRTVGTVYVDHRLRQGVFGQDEVGLVQDLADQAAIAIENARLLAENRTRQEQIARLNVQLEARVESQQAELQEVREVLRSSRNALQVQYDYRNIIGRTPRMMELFRLLDRVTETDLPVVVQGDSGTGKELVARAIHHNGRRSDRPFVSENCSAIPETLLESVLFGHVKGAFTGAERNRKGLFEVASGGSLFLDEVGEMSAAMQTKLLRVLQNGEIRPVGGTSTRTTDVRIIAASNKDLARLVADGVFREDLFYRLNVIKIEIPPLRDRREDIPLLVDHFMQKHGDHRPRRVSQEALAALLGHGWPGNVRELENEIMRATALGGEVIRCDDLSPHVGGGVPLALNDPDDLDIRTRVEHTERDLIKRALERTGGNNTHAAKLLGLSRYGLLKKIKRYGMCKQS